MPGRLADQVPDGITTLTTADYRNPDQLPDAGVLVVGGSASGVQIAEELRRSGRPVTLAVGEHVRMPRTYRGRDILWWLERVPRILISGCGRPSGCSIDTI